MSEDYLAQAQPTQTWNTVRGVWERQGIANLLCEHWELFSETWQTLGMMRSGKVYGLPTQGPRITDSEFSSLPTPTTMDAKATNNPEVIQKFLAQGKQTCLTYALIPTSTTRDYKDGQSEHKRDGVVQTDTVARAIFNSGEVLLPTTRTSMANGPTQKEIKAGNPKTRIETEVMLGETSWGKFEPAIRRWEKTLGRPSPLPTKPDGKDGAHRLSSAFTEWMMGLPEGWVTGVGLTRNEELKACGNGVVPQQAEMALRSLLQGFGEL